MADRRRWPRYVFFAPLDAQVQIVQEAVVEGWDGDRATVLTTAAAAKGDDLIIRYGSLARAVKTRTARVISSTPAAGQDGTMWFRLILSAKAGAPTWSRRSKPVERAIRQLTVDAVLLKTVAAQMKNLSASGCSLEIRTYLPVGSIGKLDMEFEGKRCLEWFRICRLETLHGRSGVHAVGAEFLRLAAAGHNSLRGAIWRIGVAPPATVRQS
jgi:hypothetical protein